MPRSFKHKFSKRAYQRYPCVISVKILIANHEFHGTALNIGFGGMLLKSPDLKAEINSQITLRFKLPTINDEIDVIAYVRWHRDDVFGMQFDATFDQSILINFFEIFSIYETLNYPSTNLFNADKEDS